MISFLRNDVFSLVVFFLFLILIPKQGETMSKYYKFEGGGYCHEDDLWSMAEQLADQEYWLVEVPDDIEEDSEEFEAFMGL